MKEKAMKKSDYWDQFDGSKALFDRCWCLARSMQAQGYDCEDLAELLETLASEEVNNEDSPYYIHG